MNQPGPADHEELAAFQAALLELLHSDLPPAHIVDQLRDDPAFDAYRDWVDTFEPRMVETAAALVKRWARRESDTHHPPTIEGG